MNNKKRFLVVIGIIFTFAMIVLLVNQGKTTAQECRIVRLHGTSYPTTTINIEPSIVRIAKGTCVIWANWVREPEVQIVFEEGKKCEDMTSSPSGFKLDAHNCYVTSFLAQGATSSLLFSEAGIFEYEVKAGSGAKEKGRIIVE